MSHKSDMLATEILQITVCAELLLWLIEQRRGQLIVDEVRDDLYEKLDELDAAGEVGNSAF